MTEEQVKASVNQRLWHRKGYYTIIVTQVMERGGVLWVHYFIEQNCDTTYAAYKDTFINIATGAKEADKNTPESMIREKHFEDNTMRVMSFDRAREMFVVDKPSKVSKLKIHILNNDDDGR